MGGRVELNRSGRFYLVTKAGLIEMQLVAEGMRKMAMLTTLVANGSLAAGTCLFWDEPEANLNPKRIKVVARAILSIGRSGVQVFIATHSLFLLRELYIQQAAPEYRDLQTQHFGLHAGDNGIAVRQGATVEDIGDITVLDKELTQSERYLELP